MASEENMGGRPNLLLRDGSRLTLSYPPLRVTNAPHLFQDEAVIAVFQVIQGKD